MNRVEEMMLPPPPSSPFWKDHNEKGRSAQPAMHTPQSGEAAISPFRASLANKEKEHMMNARSQRTSDYKRELQTLLEKSRGTPYEKTLQRFVQGKENSSVDDHEISVSIEELNYAPAPSQRSSPCVSISRDSRPLIQESPTRKMATEDICKLEKRKEKLLQDTECKQKIDNSVHLGRESFKTDEEWLQKMSAPRKVQTWAHEIEQRQSKRVVRNTTNHIGRQRPAPNVENVDMVAHTAVGVVNLTEFYNKDAISRGIHKSLKLDPHQNLMSHLVTDAKEVSVEDFNLWLDKTYKWRERITTKVKHAEQKEQDDVYTGKPSIPSRSKGIITKRAFVREGERLEREMVNNDNEIHLRHTGIHAVSRGRRSTRTGCPDDRNSSSPRLHDSIREASIDLKIRLRDLENHRELYFGHDVSDETSTVAKTSKAMTAKAKMMALASPATTEQRQENKIDKIILDEDLATFEQAEEDFQEMEAIKHYQEIAAKVAAAPTVFDRMSARIEAFNLRTSSEREQEKANMLHNSSKLVMREKAIAMMQSRSRSRSSSTSSGPRHRAGVDNCSFKPVMNKTSEKIVDRMRGRGYRSKLCHVRSSSVPAADKSTAKERFTEFVNSLQSGKGAGNQGSRGRSRSRGRNASPCASPSCVRKGGRRPSSAPPSKPVWGVRSLANEAIFNKYDSMETLALRSMKRSSRYRSTSPSVKSNSNELNTRRYSKVSPPRAKNRYANVVMDGGSATRRLSALYASREESPVPASVIGSPNEGKRRKSLTHDHNEILLSRSMIFKGKNFSERTADSVEKFVIKRGVADLMALEGFSPGPTSYSNGHDPKNISYFTKSKCSPHPGKNGFSFGNGKKGSQSRKFQQYEHLRLHGVAFKLMESSSFELSSQSQGDLLPDGVHSP